MSHDYESWKYTAGEVGVRLVIPEPTTEFLIKSSDDLMEMYCYLQARALNGQSIEEVYLPYLPYSRQDRVVTPGDPIPMSLIANTLKYCGVKKVKTDDVHSWRALDIFKEQHIQLESELPLKMFETFLKNFLHREDIEPENRQIVIVQPDTGAVYRCRNMAAALPYKTAMLGFAKKRDKITGAVTGIDYQEIYKHGHLRHNYQKDAVFVVVDDICDGGRTFTEVGKKLIEDFPLSKRTLFVTHGIFSKGLDELRQHYHAIGWKNTLCQF